MHTCEDAWAREPCACWSSLETCHGYEATRAEWEQCCWEAVGSRPGPPGHGCGCAQRSSEDGWGCCSALLCGGSESGRSQRAAHGAVVEKRGVAPGRTVEPEPEPEVAILPRHLHRAGTLLAKRARAVYSASRRRKAAFHLRPSQLALCTRNRSAGLIHAAPGRCDQHGRGRVGVAARRRGRSPAYVYNACCRIISDSATVLLRQWLVCSEARTGADEQLGARDDISGEGKGSCGTSEYTQSVRVCSLGGPQRTPPPPALAGASSTRCWCAD